MIAGRLLAELGMAPGVAIAEVRKARSRKAIEANQDSHVLATGRVNE